MIGQYLSNKNKSATVAKSEIFSELNKAEDEKNRILVRRDGSMEPYNLLLSLLRQNRREYTS